MRDKWVERNGEYILETKVGRATIRVDENMTILLITNKNGVIRDGYAQYRKPLEEEKRIAESRLKNIH